MNHGMRHSHHHRMGYLRGMSKNYTLGVAEMERFDWLKSHFSRPVDGPHMKRAPLLAPFSYADRFQLEKIIKVRKRRRDESHIFIGEEEVYDFSLLTLTKRPCNRLMILSLFGPKLATFVNQLFHYCFHIFFELNSHFVYR